MSYAQDSYDPTAPEGEVSSRGQYMTKRDMRIILISLGVFALFSVPIYRFLLGRTESSRCTRNMQGISEALTLYATEHDGRFPPIDRTETVNGIAPAVGETGNVYTWASDISGYMNVRASFLCPSAKPSELVKTDDPKGSGKSFLSSYGMYGAYGSCLTSLVESRDQTIIIAETSNGGALGSYDPSPLKSSTGQVLPDGFVIGWNDGNDETSKNTKLVTRLAFQDTQSGVFKDDGDGRHGGTIHVLSASGQLIDAKPSSATYAAGKQINPQWKLPPISSQNR